MIMNIWAEDPHGRVIRTGRVDVEDKAAVEAWGRSIGHETRVDVFSDDGLEARVYPLSVTP